MDVVAGVVVVGVGHHKVELRVGVNSLDRKLLRGRVGVPLGVVLVASAALSP